MLRMRAVPFPERKRATPAGSLGGDSGMVVCLGDHQAWAAAPGAGRKTGPRDEGRTAPMRRSGPSYSRNTRDGVITTPFDCPCAEKVSIRVA